MAERFSNINLKALLKVHQNNIDHSICVRHRRRPSHLSSGWVYQYILSLNKFLNLIRWPMKTYHFYFSRQWMVAVLSVLDWNNSPHFGKKFQKFVQFQTDDDSHIVEVDSCYTQQGAERSSRRGIPYVMVLQQYMAELVRMVENDIQSKWRKFTWTEDWKLIGGCPLDRLDFDPISLLELDVLFTDWSPPDSPATRSLNRCALLAFLYSFESL